ncbi:hypothetical protein [Rubrivivax rivuli]|uniref:Lipoprotein n=1 Tax=Rubrivivax rivuli TaxID=1862385 RepID=A0A437RK95_9BURK|nr:hypothetical protein [Rubrivivax rivuli]RVU47065.1 hypothetical protein EOE66_04675 [Rubrivivax rivuli]
MKSILTLSTAALFITLAGCGTRPPKVYEDWVIPAVGKVAIRSIGDILIEQGYSEIGTEIEFAEDVTVGKVKLPRGKYHYNTENSTGTWFYKGDYYFYVDKTNNQICIDGKDCVKHDFSMGRGPIPDTAKADSLQQTLLYNGKIGNRITLAYRELQNNMARPAFNNTVEYDLSESNVIGYKGARIEVIKATNTEITYRIISGFQK